MSVRHMRWVLIGFLAVLSAPALSQNLVANGGFNADITSRGWVSYGSVVALDGTRSHDTPDAAGNALSGSARMSLTGTAVGTVIGLSQCIDISSQAALSTYKFFASVESPSSGSEPKASRRPVCREQRC
jgi:hypothetical protein